jgi:hypothetical protein
MNWVIPSTSIIHIFKKCKFVESSVHFLRSPWFRNPTMLIKHYRDDHGSFPPMFENKPKFICSHCSNIYISEKSLKAHAFTAHSKKPKRIGPKILVKCSFCEKTYGTKQRLRDHVIMEHENRPVLLLGHIFLWCFKGDPFQSQLFI